ncbi:MAG: hypothetical protein R3F60_05645 [bacterium]
MDRSTLLSDGTMGFLLGGLVLLILMTRWWRRPRQRAAPQAPSGVGAALAYALDGELGHARQLLEARVRASGGAEADAVLALLAVLRAEGRHARAAALVQALLRRQPTPWLAAAAVKICLDAGLPSRAAALAERLTVPVDLHVAALVRAGQMGRAGAVLARRGGRKEREPAQLASVLAALALERAREGDERGAKRRLKRALAVAPDAVAVLAVASRLRSREADRARAAARLAERCGGTPAVVLGIEDADGPLPTARRLFAQGATEQALGRLRDHLDAHPADDDARRQYERWLLDAGEPADWRAALAERAERVVEPTLIAATVLACRHCGLGLPEPVFLCPRCDRFDTLERSTPGALRPGVVPAFAGTRVSDLVPPEALSEHGPDGR